jgi:hypothetical protein
MRRPPRRCLARVRWRWRWWRARRLSRRLQHRLDRVARCGRRRRRGRGHRSGWGAGGVRGCRVHTPGRDKKWPAGWKWRPRWIRRPVRAGHEFARCRWPPRRRVEPPLAHGSGGRSLVMRCCCAVAGLSRGRGHASCTLRQVAVVVSEPESVQNHRTAVLSTNRSPRSAFTGGAFSVDGSRCSGAVPLRGSSHAP